MKKLFILVSVIAVAIAFIGCGGQHDVNGPMNSLGKQASLNMPLQGEGDLGDFVWVDSNCNGIQDEGERGMPNVEVKLYTCEDSLVETMNTDSTGHYLFSQIMPGQYYVHFDLPDGYMFSPMNQGDNDSLDSDVNPETGNTECITQDSAEVDLSMDAGFCSEQPEEGCTRGKGYWKTHAGFGPQPDTVTPLLPIMLGTSDGDSSLNVTTAEIAHDVLVMFTYGRPSNGITKLYAQLLAAKLNIANGASDEDIAETIGMADDFLATHTWNSWTMLSGEDRQMILSWMGQLEEYNEGYIGPGSCDGRDHEYEGEHDADK
jgi:hypothetical protein